MGVYRSFPSYFTSIVCAALDSASTASPTVKLEQNVHTLLQKLVYYCTGARSVPPDPQKKAKAEALRLQRETKRKEQEAKNRRLSTYLNMEASPAVLRRKSVAPPRVKQRAGVFVSE